MVNTMTGIETEKGNSYAGIENNDIEKKIMVIILMMMVMIMNMNQSIKSMMIDHTTTWQKMIIWQKVFRKTQRQCWVEATVCATITAPNNWHLCILDRQTQTHNVSTIIPNRKRQFVTTYRTRLGRWLQLAHYATNGPGLNTFPEDDVRLADINLDDPLPHLLNMISCVTWTIMRIIHYQWVQTQRRLLPRITINLVFRLWLTNNNINWLTIVIEIEITL